MKKILDIFKKPLWLLCLGLGIVLVASIFANVSNTSLYSVSVTEQKFETEREDGEMHVLVYRPRQCTASNPCATIVTTHGYLNTKEMQDAPAIELSRRGYVVIAVDMYDHGDSTWNTEEYGAFMFAMYSQWDAVQWAYEQDYVLKAPDGTGMIAVSGHSMGGFSSRMAATWDSMAVAGGAKQKIAAVLAVGADFKYYWLGTEDSAIAADAAAKRTMGTIGGRYDEFFFLDNSTSETVVEKDWTKTEAGAKFYYAEDYTSTSPEFKSGEWNTESYNGGGSVIYVPNEIHPWNHFSVETTGYMVDFYTKAFKTQFDLHSVTPTTRYNTSSKAQTWWLKEGFECLGLVGMFTSIVAFIGLFAQLPFFNKMVTVASESEAEDCGCECGCAKEGEKKCTCKCCPKSVLVNAISLLGGFGSAYVFVLMNTSSLSTITGPLAQIKWLAGLILVGLVIAKVVIRALKGADSEANHLITRALVNVIVVYAACFAATYALNRDWMTNSKFYNEPTSTQIATWAVLAGFLTLVTLSLTALVSGDAKPLERYGLKANWKSILIALLTAVIGVVSVYVITFAIEALLKVDFRIWTYVIKPFGWNQFLAFLKYLPAFFFFYLVNAMSIVASTGKDKSWKGTLKAVLTNAGFVALILVLHYGYDFVTGAARWPTEALSNILLWAFVPTLALAALITRKSYQKTGNIWLAVFINAFLFTMIQVANTTLYVYH